MTGSKRSEVQGHLWLQTRGGEGRGGGGKGGEKGKIWERRRGEGRPTAGLLILCTYKENYFGGCRDGLAVKSGYSSSREHKWASQHSFRAFIMVTPAPEDPLMQTYTYTWIKTKKTTRRGKNLQRLNILMYSQILYLSTFEAFLLLLIDDFAGY